MSVERTKRIVEAYFEYIHPDWPTLIFATSVEHAQTVAALLNHRGIRSRAVSGNTETTVRRGVVEEFRLGEIKAFVNYGVFCEGFDAPSRCFPCYFLAHKIRQAASKMTQMTLTPLGYFTHYQTNSDISH